MKNPIGRIGDSCLLIADARDDDSSVELLKSIIDSHKLCLTGRDAYELYRIEKGIAAAPNEINLNHNPYDLDMLREVNFNKGCYIGQEVIERLDAYEKVKNQFKGAIFQEKDIPYGKYTVTNSEGAAAGNITSITFSPKLQNYIGLGIIRNDFARSGTRLIANDGGEKKFEVIVSNLPFI